MLKQYSKAIAVIIMLFAFTLGAQAAKPKVDEETFQELHNLKGQQSQLETQERLLKLKTALALREEQLSVWGDYEQHMLQSSEMRHTMRGEMRERRMQRQAPPTSLEMAEKNVERLERQLAHAQERLAVFSALYNSLDEEQQATIDKLALRKVKRQAKKLRKMRDKG